MLRIFLFSLAVLALGACGSDDSAEVVADSRLGYQLPLYDDFNSGSIDGAKWVVNQTAVDGVTIIVNDLAVVGGALEGTLTVDGIASGSTNRVYFADPTGMDAMYVDVTVLDYVQSSGVLQARLSGYFFNDGDAANTGPGDATGDVSARVRLRDGFVHFSVIKCTDAACNTAIVIGPYQTIGTVSIGETQGLYLAWDGGTTFTAQLNSDTPVTLDTSIYGFSNMAAPKSGFSPRRIGIRADTGTSGTITAAFDNVRAG